MTYRGTEDALRAQIDALTAEVDRLRVIAEGRAEPRRARPDRAAWLFVIAAVLVAALALFLAWGVGGYDFEIAAVSIAVVAVVLLWLAIIVSLTIVVGPREAVLLFGRGGPHGFRLVRGRAVRIPFIETVERLDTSPFSVRGNVDRMSTRDRRIASCHWVAHVRFDPTEEGIARAVPRFLHRSPEDTRKLCIEMIDGVVRAVIAHTTAQQLEEDRGIVGDAVVHEAKDDFEKLGLEVETLIFLDVHLTHAGS